MTNILLDQAIAYVEEKNWFVFPTREKDGKPYINEKGKEVKPLVKSPYTKKGFNDATQNKDIIAGWWKRKPEAGIGIACGPSNLAVIDIDVRGDKKGFDNFMTLNIPDEGAFHSLTPSGGIHIIFSGSMDSHANVKAGIDIRSRGAYIVAPPSWIYEDGKKLSYIQVEEKWEGQPIRVPISLEEKLEELRGKKNKGERKTTTVNPDEPIEKTIERLRIALNQLPSWMCEDYFSWVNTGMALKTIGDEGFTLWDEWSRKSSKYDRDALEYRWDNFKPSKITIASIFHYAKMEQVGKNA